MTEENKPNSTATDETKPAEAAKPAETVAEASTSALPAQAGEAEVAAPTTAPSASDYADLRVGMTVQVHQKIRETNTKGEEKERIQIYEGMIIARRHGYEAGSTITVRKVSDGVGVEKIFPLNSPNVVKIVAIKQAKVRRASLHYLKNWGKRLKETILKK
ncbi:MAG: 50S ribosomal protein L19 [Patescibacteria group bacterium]|jgi:large subunit ribosomal protein L19